LRLEGAGCRCGEAVPPPGTGGGAISRSEIARPLRCAPPADPLGLARDRQGRPFGFAPDGRDSLRSGDGGHQRGTNKVSVEP
jgi:hypothetical protein